MFELLSSVGNSRENDEGDVLGVKKALSGFGFFDFGKSSAEPHGIFTRELQDGIKSFQAENGLRVDGILNPAGETENALRGRFAAEGNAPEGSFVFAQKRASEFDATGRRIVDVGRGKFNTSDMLALAEKYKPMPFREEAIKRKLQERQAKHAAGPERKNTDSAFKGLKIEKMMEQQENQPVTYEPGNDKHQWGVGDWLNRGIIEPAFGVEPKDTKLRKFKDNWIKDKKEIIKKTAEKHNLPPEMLAGIVWMEAGGQPDIGDSIVLLARQYGILQDRGSNTTSTGDVSIQLRHVAEMEGLDPDKMTRTQENAIFNKLQDENYNLEVVARHIADMRDKVYPEKKGQKLNAEQIKRLGYMYNMGAAHKNLQRDKDLANAKDIVYAGEETSSYGYDLIQKLERMKSLIEKQE